MGLLIGAGAVALFASVFLICGTALVNKGKAFETNKRRGHAKVVGYDRADESDWYMLYVQILELNDGKTYRCSGGKINPGDYPVGMIVDVLFAPKKVAGLNIVEIHLLDNAPADGKKAGGVFKKLAIALFAVAGVLAGTGMITLL